MGAGDGGEFVGGEAADLKVDVEGAQPGEEFLATFDPHAFFGARPPALRRRSS